MSLTILGSTFTYLLYILSLVLSLVAECARKRPAPSSATSESTSRESSASAKKRDTKKGSHEPNDIKQTPKGIDSNDVIKQAPKGMDSNGVAQKKAETPAEAKKELPAKVVTKPPAAKDKEAEKGEAPPRDEVKTVARPLGKDGGEGAVTAADGADFIDFQGSKPVSMVLNEPAPKSDPGDGNYEDVNLVEAEAPEHQKTQLTIDPLKATFAASGGRSTHTLLNAGDARVVFKVKCSNNQDYRIKPVYGYVDPIGSHLIFVVRLPGPVKSDKMVVQWGVAAAEKTEPVVAFKKLAPTSLQQIIVPFTVTAAGPAGAKPSPGVPSPSPAPKPAGAANNKVPASSPKKK